MNRIYLLLTLILCNSMPIIASFEIQNEDVNYLETKNFEEKKYYIECPSDWIKTSVTPFHDLYISSSTKDLTPTAPINMHVITRHVDSPVTLEELYTEAITMLSSMTPILKTGDLDINGVPSKWITYAFSENDQETQILQFLIVDQETQFLILFVMVPEDDESYSEFEKITSSFRVL
ncbi:MAG TPA: hypothetical protein VGP47_03150 [Parachlamydiaceae bacterium]|nr:hypothetical protein [Parachlamydiaceae bacterium]